MSTVRLPLVQPFPWQALLDYLALRCIPGVEAVEGTSYHRFGVVRANLAGAALELDIAPGADGALAQHRIAHLFRPMLATANIDAALSSDPRLAPAVQAAPGMRLPGTWSGFELAARVVIGQQVTVAAARTLLARVVQRCGGEMTPARLLAADLANIGMPQARTDTVLRVATLASTVDFDATPWPDLRPQVAALKGIGPWTLGYLDMRLGLLDDIFPAADVGLQLACGERNAKRLAQHAERWAPWRSFAALRLWQA